MARKLRIQYSGAIYQVVNQAGAATERLRVEQLSAISGDAVAPTALVAGGPAVGGVMPPQRQRSGGGGCWRSGWNGGGARQGRGRSSGWNRAGDWAGSSFGRNCWSRWRRGLGRGITGRRCRKPKRCRRSGGWWGGWREWGGSRPISRPAARETRGRLSWPGN